MPKITFPDFVIAGGPVTPEKRAAAKEIEMSMSKMQRDGEPRVTGVSRVSDNNRVLALSFTVPPTDDELRSLHNFLRGWKPSRN